MRRFTTRWSSGLLVFAVGGAFVPAQASNGIYLEVDGSTFDQPVPYGEESLTFDAHYRCDGGAEEGTIPRRMLIWCERNVDFEIEWAYTDESGAGTFGVHKDSAGHEWDTRPSHNRACGPAEAPVLLVRRCEDTRHLEVCIESSVESCRYCADGDCEPPPIEEEDGTGHEEEDGTGREEAEDLSFVKAHQKAHWKFWCGTAWRGNPNGIDESCTFAELDADVDARRCVFIDVVCRDDAGGEVSNGNWKLSADELRAMKSCDGRFTLTVDGECPVDETMDTPSYPAPPPPPEEEERFDEERAEEQRQAMLDQCRTAWDASLYNCRADGMRSNEDGTACLVDEPIYCNQDHLSYDFDTPNWPGKERWTPAEIEAADSCGGTLHLDGC